MKSITKFLILIVTLASCLFLHSQDILEEIVTWELDEGTNFLCANSNKKGGDLNNDGYDDFIHISYNNITGEKMFQFYFGSSNSDTQPDLVIPTETYVNLVPSWGGDLNGNGYNDIIFTENTHWGDAGDICICFGGEEIDLTPDLILHGEDYAPDSYNLCFGGHNGGYDFNGDGYNDLLAGGSGPDMFYNGQVDIFFGGEQMDNVVDFHIQGACQERFGVYKAVGDINGDGYDDLIVSRKIDPINIDDMKLEIYLGGEEMDTILDAEIPESWFDFFDILAYGDLNNDNFDDLLLTGSLDGQTFIIGLYLGSNNISELVLHTYESFPNGGFSYMDINNDEYDDLISTFKYNGIGYVNIFLGSDTFDFEPEYSIQFGNFNNQYGKIGCNLGDFNGDGKDDILVNNGEPYNSASMYGLAGVDSVDDSNLPTTNIKLMNYPNPFNPVTTISYNLPVNIANPVIEIFNIKGEKIRTFNCQNQMPVIWEGTDNHQNQVSSGIYLYRIKSDEGVLLSKKMILLK